MKPASRLRFVLIATLATVGCAGAPGPASLTDAGTKTVRLSEWAGLQPRSYRLHVPAGLTSSPAPLVVALHGAFSSARIMEGRSGLNAAAERHGFVVAYPNGEGLLGRIRHWNAGECCGPASFRGRDDVGFVGRVIDDVARRLPIDPERVYLTGFSNGGMLAWRFASEHPERVAAVAPVAAMAAVALPGDGAAVPLILFHGAADPVIPADDVEASLDSWARRNGCAPDPSEAHLREGLLRMRTWRSCASGGAVEAWELAGWGHRWPGPHFSDARVDGLRGFDGAEILWRFFESSFRAERASSSRQASLAR
ncbi:MAG: alpha/beta fold hydrolase [Myxococcota bacterium]|nr:alpha/beta fold hydrolase [Myxococcota bacterium]